MLWGDKTLEGEIVLKIYKTFVVAEYPPLQLSCEGSNEREARDGLMAMFWRLIASMLERKLKPYEPGSTIKEMVYNIEEAYYSLHPRPEIVREEKYGVIEIELGTDDQN